jgi:hypothetical protein
MRETSQRDIPSEYSTSSKNKNNSNHCYCCYYYYSKKDSFDSFSLSNERYSIQQNKEEKKDKCNKTNTKIKFRKPVPVRFGFPRKKAAKGCLESAGEQSQISLDFLSPKNYLHYSHPLSSPSNHFSDIWMHDWLRTDLRSC